MPQVIVATQNYRRFRGCASLGRLVPTDTPETMRRGAKPITFARHLLAAVALLALLVDTAWTQGPAWPARPVRVIATSPPGGSVDLLARVLADEFTRSFGQPFVVENRPGANGNIGVDAVVKAPPDGHMLFVTIPGVFSINMHLHAKMPFDPVTEIAPIAMLGYSPLLLMLHPSVPANNVAELLAWLRKQAGKASYASQGVGTTGHLAMELLKSMTGVDVVHVPYKGAAAATTDLLAGNVLLSFINTTAAIPMVQKGQLRAIAVAEKHRLPVAPDLPTMHEAGVPGFEVTPWFGLGTRTGVPRPIIDRLSNEAARVLKLPDVEARLAKVGVDARPMQADAFTAYIRTETERWGLLIRRSGAKAE